MIDISCKKTLGEFSLDAKLSIANGEFCAIYGHSGSGKTTLLRILAGFLRPDSGFCKNGDFIYFDEKIFTPPQKRNIGLLFQDYALFPNMSVKENLLFAKNDEKAARNLLELSEIANLANAKISELSGGQKQRVALARALMRKPEILLLDEPFSALDSKIKTKLQDYLKRIHSEFKNTIIIVSHDVGEIYKLAHKVFVINGGKITNSGSPSEVFSKSSGSQKFSFCGEILDIEKSDGIFIFSIQIGEQINKVVLSSLEAEGLQIGDKVILSAKAFKITMKGI